MDKYKLDKPWYYKDDWAVFPNTVLSQIKITDCADTTRGVCIDNRTVEKCMDFCEEDGDQCGAGYHIQFNDNRSICVPIRTAVNSHINPVHRLRRQSIYPEFDNVVVKTFVNTKKFSFPPRQANTVFYHDILILRNVNLNLTFGGKQFLLKEHETTGFVKDEKLNINLLPKERSSTQISKYLPLRYGDYFNINVPGTTLLLTKDAINNNLVWVQGRGLAESEYAKFQIIPVNDEKNVGDLVEYVDKFIIKYNKIDIAVVNKTFHTFITKGSASNKKNDNTFFNFISKMKGYYCDNGECKSIPIKKIDNMGKYKGSIVGRNPGCWGVCSYKHPSFKQCIIICMIAMIVLVVYLYYKYNYTR
jgi:hypothetical protein